MLRFNGQSPVQAQGAYSAVPGRTVGTVSGVTTQTGMQPLWSANRAQTAAFGELAGIPDGTVHPVAWLMPLQSGRISARGTEIDFTASAPLIAGFPIQGITSMVFTVGPSQLELVVSASGDASFAFTATGNAAAVLQAVGAIAVNFTVTPATLGAESGIFGNAPVTFSGTVTARADGNIEGAVSPYTELSPENLAAAVWEALLSEYQTPGSAGKALVDAKTLAQLAASLAAAV